MPRMYIISSTNKAHTRILAAFVLALAAQTVGGIEKHARVGYKWPAVIQQDDVLDRVTVADGQQPWQDMHFNSTTDKIRWVVAHVAEKVGKPTLVVPVLLGFSLLVLMLFSFVDCGRRKAECESVLEASSPTKLHTWSTPAILALTSYRFYTGFLSATWMPYLLAMEGQQLLTDRQSFFMGTAKLIYGMSILLNPMFGLVGDQMAVVSHWSGRRLFVLVGVGVSGLGIYGCLVAAQILSVGWYLLGVVLWMLGEAMADVTTETLVPELLPREQYDISSALRSLNFLLGGLVGYAALIVFRNVHYSWLYYGYLIVMLVCAFLTLVSMNTEDLQTPDGNRKRPNMSLGALIKQAYCAPARYDGGFPRACLCLFIFSLGSAPMFFLLLFVRDIIGIKDHEPMQTHFSVISIAFFVAAAVASIVGAALASGSRSSDSASSSADATATISGPEAGAGGQRGVRSLEEVNEDERRAVVMRWRLMVISTVGFGVVVIAIPLVGILPTLTVRTVSFYVVGVFLGITFGAVYSRFQECTWSLLPDGVDVANAMGFAAMSKLAGVGIGNFGAGLILDCYADGSNAYMLRGYALMCAVCTSVVLLSAYYAHTVGVMALDVFDKQSRESFHASKA